jgi:hypothetical protein
MSSTNRGGKRTPADFYPTPAWCIRRIVEAVDLPGGDWLEPGAGDGAVIRTVNQYRDDVNWFALDIVEACCTELRTIEPAVHVACRDFIEAPVKRRYRVALTNPPYFLAEQFLCKCLQVADNVVFLLRLNFLASAKRSGLMRANTPDVYILPNRPSFSGRGTDSVEYAWFHFHDNRS